MRTNEQILLKIMSERPMTIRQIADRMSRGRKEPASDGLVRALMSHLRSQGYVFRKRSVYRLDDRTHLAGLEETRREPARGKSAGEIP